MSSILDAELDTGSEFDGIFAASDSKTQEQIDLKDVSAELAQVLELLRIDAEFFIEFFLAEELSSEVPQFHKEIWGMLTKLDLERVLLAIPRDHAKTTLAKLCVVWYFLFTPHRFCTYLSNTNAIAKNACRDIMAFFKNSNFVAVFGHVKVLKESETESLWMFEVPMGNGRVKQCILRAVGAGQQMRGINIDNQRPDITVVDDVEDNENTESELQQKKLDKWIFGPYLKALARRKKIIWLGNMLQKTSLLARLSRNPKWNPVVFGAMVQNAVTGALTALWPSRWSIEELIEYRELGLTETWLCEMMNMPGHGENGFTSESIKYGVVPTPGGNSQIKGAFLTLDPAFGEKQHNDNSAIVVHLIPEDGPPIVGEYFHGKTDEVGLLHEMVRLATKWNAWTWGIESVAAQKVLITLFTVLLNGMGMTGQVEMLPLMAGKGDPKVGRIKAWVALMANGEYEIPEGDIEITNQLLTYNMKAKNNKDDLIDSCAYGPQMLQLYEHVIIEQFNGARESDSAPQSGRRVADV
jgi:hypothetical protein